MSDNTVSSFSAQSSMNALWQARYGTRPPAQPLPESPVARSLMAHRSVRHFSPAPLPEGVVEAAIAAAQSASSSCNLQAWSVIAVRDPARRARLAKIAGDQAFIVQAPLFLAWVVDLSRLEHVGQAQGRALPGLDCLDTFLGGAVDTALAGQNAAATFESYGLGIVYVGAVRNQPEAIAAELGLPPRTFALFGMSVGYPDRAQPTTIRPRLPQALVLHEERYNPAAATDEASINAYDDHLRAARAGARSWSESVVARLGDTGALHGREHLPAALRALGFVLGKA
ncbi:NADPH-dependent oxidoreductase [Komagataeibacter nataicola]|uniref:NADPH-dependent oxidoreductase n=1 Tax=Komagataeibacter nataicola TaxID=265960 RepID=A0A9N7CYB6_9PROT|nr:nitroreductase family protein [Komagataeibacter nataicola]AQU87766.1 NADPH-dependent oxidoreductase [Komagataeibacter nataicola]PYD65501.1 NADPH-dependent oxidoreductase [Komagataeibacter nataicola]WEQ55510.1 nitroreductase family protein [Komagataeibacter nataicola]WNM09634.1 nitroreductase family protein [Komagataeibacter nataicola]GBR16396.1 nitroreductase [Komagataeibacter nataicola NRIC 0616]